MEQSEGTICRCWDWPELDVLAKQVKERSGLKVAATGRLDMLLNVDWAFKVVIPFGTLG